MTNIYTWRIESLDCVPSTDGLTNVVANIHWRVNGSNDRFTASVYGNRLLKHSPNADFTAYDNLTEETVLGWLKDAIGAEQVASIETNLDNQLDTLANPPVVSLPLPWAK
jgi:hypothetical protein